MSKIVVLDELTANKIAAGEVVERPASIVKELIENSIDAGSTRIEITIADGGMTAINIADNGSGMDSQDASLAFERHATSKIRDAEDLDRIQSLGFRGEALPSIAAVSKLHLKTRTRESISGTEVVIEGGRIMKNSEAGCPIGTIIDVRDLFYNTPARKKHLKSMTTESGHISDVVNKFAMGYPHISFQLKSNGRLILKTSGKGDLRECIASVYGSDTAREMLLVQADTGDHAISGYIGKPLISRAGRHHQIVFINGRYVRSRIISEAVEKAFHSMLMVGRHPVFVINININPQDVDVNVHPAKTEIRLMSPSSLEDFVTSVISDALANSRLIPAAETVPRPVTRATKNEADQQSWNMPTNAQAPNETADQPGEKTVSISPVSVEQAASLKHEPTVKHIPADSIKHTPADPVKHIPENPINSEYEFVSKAEFPAAQESGPTSPYNTPVPPAVNISDNETSFPELRPIGQINSTYIVAQGADGMYLIDQHAAHERVLYEKFMAKPEQYTACEQLLFPTALQLTFQEAQILNDNIVNLTDLGFVIEHFGGETFLLRGVPSGASPNGGKEIFLDLLDYFSHNRRTISGKALREKVLITMACKQAIKANHKLGLPEMESLLGQLAYAANPYTCPHGRPTLIHFSGYDLEKRFKRVL